MNLSFLSNRDSRLSFLSNRDSREGLASRRALASARLSYPLRPPSRRMPCAAAAVASVVGGGDAAWSLAHDSSRALRWLSCALNAAHAASATVSTSSDSWTLDVARSWRTISVSAANRLPASAGSSRKRTLCTHTSLSNCACFCAPPHTNAASLSSFPAVVSHAAPTAPIKRSERAPGTAESLAYVLSVLRTSPRHDLTWYPSIPSKEDHGSGLDQEETCATEASSTLPCPPARISRTRAEKASHTGPPRTLRWSSSSRSTGAMTGVDMDGSTIISSTRSSSGSSANPSPPWSSTSSSSR